MHNTDELLTERGSVYGDPKVNMACAAELKLTMRKYMEARLDPAEIEALDMCLTKISRIITGKKYHRDNYDDLIGYATIAIRLNEKTPVYNFESPVHTYDGTDKTRV